MHLKPGLILLYRRILAVLMRPITWVMIRGCQIDFIDGSIHILNSSDRDDEHARQGAKTVKEALNILEDKDSSLRMRVRESLRIIAFTDGARRFMPFEKVYLSRFDDRAFTDPWQMAMDLVWMATYIAEYDTGLYGARDPKARRAAFRALKTFVELPEVPLWLVDQLRRPGGKQRYNL